MNVNTIFIHDSQTRIKPNVYQQMNDQNNHLIFRYQNNIYESQEHDEQKKSGTHVTCMIPVVTNKFQNRQKQTTVQ